MTQDQIAEVAARIRALGVPDSLNRWLKMTPEAFAENEKARARIVKQVRDRAPVRHNEKPARSTISTGLPRGLEPAGKTMLQEIQKAAVAAKKARLRKMNEDRIMKTKTKTKAAKAAPKAKAAAKAPKAPKTARAPKIAPEAAPKVAVAGVRAGSKTALIGEMLLRSQGCTTAEVLEASGWPSVSMPQQAKACGLALRKEKEKGQPTRYYGVAGEPTEATTPPAETEVEAEKEAEAA